jgi:hypothetical protein
LPSAGVQRGRKDKGKPKRQPAADHARRYRA